MMMTIEVTIKFTVLEGRWFVYGRLDLSSVLLGMWYKGVILYDVPPKVVGFFLTIILQKINGKNNIYNISRVIIQNRKEK